jgi:phospholipid/cholesterol/gamma-HCH transport system permease protein
MGVDELLAKLAGILANDTFDIGLRQKSEFFSISILHSIRHTHLLLSLVVFPAYYGYYVKRRGT